MSLGKLLTTGKSLMAGHGASRYQMHKNIRLPKFGSARNPFAPETRTPALSATHDGASAELPVAAPDQIGTPPRFAVPLAVLGKAVREVGAKWGRMNPFSRLMGQPGPARSMTAQLGVTTPVQVELSLEKVQVVRNDLSDADLEIIPVTMPVSPAEPPPLMAAIGKHEPAGNAWTRLSTRFFGAGTTS